MRIVMPVYMFHRCRPVPVGAATTPQQVHKLRSRCTNC